MLTDENQWALSGIEATQDCLIEWQGKTWPAAMSTRKKRDALGAGGVMVDYDLTVIIRDNALAQESVETFASVTQPDNGDEITVNDVLYQIQQVTVGAGYVNLALANLHKP